MNNLEFSNEFDILFQNMNAGSAPGLTEYEKSVMLTQASEKVLIDLVASNNLDIVANSIKTVNILPITGSTPLTETSVFFTLPDDYLRLVNEFVKSAESSRNLSVVPITHEELKSLLFRPYPYPRKRTAWRVINSNDAVEKLVEIVCRPNCTAKHYILTYAKLPIPIILDGVTETIRGVTGPSETDLPSSVHPVILETAVQLANITYIGTNAQQG